MLLDEVAILKHKWRRTAEAGGGHCPVCERWGMVYARTLNRTMVKSLIWLCQEYVRKGSAWIDVPNTAPRFVIRSNQLPVLTSWGLVERCPKDSKEGGAKHSGLWRPTEKGYQFYDRKIKVPKKAIAYNNKIEGFSKEEVYIDECFKTFFDYNEAMGRNFDD
jgi:hypothetical protein